MSHNADVTIIYRFLFINSAKTFFFNYSSAFCSCSLDESYRSRLLDITNAYQNGTEELVKSGRYDTSDDFTVVIQPFMKLMKPPKTVFFFYYV